MLSFFKNICRFNQCGLEFASLYDLIQHIEETHITNDAEYQKRFELLQQHGQHQAAPLVPLSYICRYYQKLPDKKAKPVVNEPVNLQTSIIGASPFAGTKKAQQQQQQLPPPNFPPGVAVMPSVPGIGGVSVTPGSSISVGGAGVGAVSGHSTTATTTVMNFQPPAPPLSMNHPITIKASIGPNETADDETISVSNDSISSDSTTTVDDANSASLNNTVDSSGTTLIGHRFLTPSGVPQDRRFVYQIPETKKRYKNSGGGARYQAKMAQGHAMRDHPHNYKAHKCDVCNKAYKTPNGLHNHQLQMHNKLPNGQQQGQQSSMMGGALNSTFQALKHHPAAPSQPPTIPMQQQQSGVSSSQTGGGGGGLLPVTLITAGSGGVKAGGTAIRVSPAPSPSSLTHGHHHHHHLKFGGGGQGGAPISPLSVLPSGVSIQVQPAPGSSMHSQQQPSIGHVTKTALGGGGGGPVRARPFAGVTASGLKRSGSNAHLTMTGAQLTRPVKIAATSSTGGGVVVTTSVVVSGGQHMYGGGNNSMNSSGQQQAMTTTKIHVNSSTGVTTVLTGGGGAPSPLLVQQQQQQESSSASSDQLTSGQLTSSQLTTPKSVMGPPGATAHEYAKK